MKINDATEANPFPEPAQPRPAEELYHVALDPLEEHNLADRPEYQAVKADLAAKLEQWMDDTGDFAHKGITPERPEDPGWGPWDDKVRN